jgi:hypothetical protein
MEISKREFLARFGGLSVGGLFVPETAGFFKADSWGPLQRRVNRDEYEAIFYCYGKMVFTGQEAYAARQSDTKYQEMLEREITGFRQDMLAWRKKPLGTVWPEIS